MISSKASGGENSALPSWQPRLVRGENTDQLVDFVLLAEFDIDTGSTLRHQYPSNIPGYNADWFAEHMLPEGVHNRTTDYTYIFLNRQGSILDEPKVTSTTSIDTNTTNNSTISTTSITTANDLPGAESQPFLFGLNCVKTKHDSSVRRGAIVKSMCLFTRYSFVESIKLPLEQALEAYFNEPSLGVLQDLFESLNTVSLQHLPCPNHIERLLMRRGVTHDHLRPACPDHLHASWSRNVTYKGDVTLSIPIYRTIDEVGAVSVSHLLKIFGESSMRIYHAILTKQRVLFVGYNHAASDIAQMVLSAVAMVCPPFLGLVRRTFPYATLFDLTFLEVAALIIMGYGLWVVGDGLW
ncbi:hypothetical protein EON64_03745 [archaeon]|nr:MAG: hypothetical protein EON64_03745 [archaeon]